MIMIFISCKSPTHLSEPNDISETTQSGQDGLPTVVISPETRAILSAARAVAPIDTTGWFAYGVLDMERTETSCRVGYYNARVLEIYRFYYRDNEWRKGERLEHSALNRLGKVQDGQQVYQIQSYTQKIATIYANGQVLTNGL